MMVDVLKELVLLLMVLCVFIEEFRNLLSVMLFWLVAFFLY